MFVVVYKQCEHKSDVVSTWAKLDGCMTHAHMCVLLGQELV